MEGDQHLWTIGCLFQEREKNHFPHLNFILLYSFSTYFYITSHHLFVSNLEFYINEIIQYVYVWLFFFFPFSILLLCASDMLSLGQINAGSYEISKHLVTFNELILLNGAEIQLSCEKGDLSGLNCLQALSIFFSWSQVTRVGLHVCSLCVIRINFLEVQQSKHNTWLVVGDHRLGSPGGTWHWLEGCCLLPSCVGDPGLLWLGHRWLPYGANLELLEARQRVWWGKANLLQSLQGICVQEVEIWEVMHLGAQ